MSSGEDDNSTLYAIADSERSDRNHTLYAIADSERSDRIVGVD